MRLSGYPNQHWDGCMCDLCDSIFTSHNPDRSGPICSCGGCRTREAAIRTNRKTTANYNSQGREKKVATVNFCERCNAMGKSVAMGHIMYATGTTPWTAEMEICPGCVADLLAFWKGDAVPAIADVERPKSYSEPYTARKADPLADLSDEQLAAAYLSRVAAREGLNELTDGSDGTV